jgi:hypothetical protein
LDAQAELPDLLADELDAGALVDEDDEFFSRNFLLMLTALNLLVCGGGWGACEPSGTRVERRGAMGFGSAKGMDTGAAAGVSGASTTGLGVSSGKLLVWVSSLAIDQDLCGFFQV